MQLFKRLKSRPFDLKIEFGCGWQGAWLQWDGVGRPYVQPCEEVKFLLADGKTRGSYNQWLPLSEKAVDIFKNGPAS